MNLTSQLPRAMGAPPQWCGAMFDAESYCELAPGHYPTGSWHRTHGPRSLTAWIEYGEQKTRTGEWVPIEVRRSPTGWGPVTTPVDAPDPVPLTPTGYVPKATLATVLMGELNDARRGIRHRNFTIALLMLVIVALAVRLIT